MLHWKKIVSEGKHNSSAKQKQFPLVSINQVFPRRMDYSYRHQNKAQARQSPRTGEGAPLD